MQPVLENGWSIPPAPVLAPVVVPTAQPYFAVGPQLFPAQQLAAMVSPQPFSIVVQPQPDLSGAVYANQIEVELGSRAITLPSTEFIDVEQLEHQLGAAPTPAPAAPEAPKAEKKPKKPKKKEDKEAAKAAPKKEGIPQAKQTLAAITDGIAQVFNSSGKAAIPAGELKVAVEKVVGYAAVIEAYARAGTFKPAANCGPELAAFIQLIKARIDAFFVELEAPFAVRRVEKAKKPEKSEKVEKAEKPAKEKKKKWVPATTAVPTEAPAAAAVPAAQPAPEPAVPAEPTLAAAEEGAKAE
eukprot:EG_transcript_9963